MDENRIPSEQGRTLPSENTTPATPNPTPTRSGYTVTSGGGFYSSAPTQPTPTPQRPQPTPTNTVYQRPVQPTPPTPPTPPKKQPKGFSLLTVVVSVVLAAIIGAACATATCTSLLQNNKDGKTGNKESSGITTSDDVAISNPDNVTIDVSDVDTTIGIAIAEKVTPSVVGIRTTVMYSSYFGEQESSGEGSGVIYTSDGYIITNYHVIEEAVEYAAEDDAIQVFLSDDPEKGYPATVIGYNISNDLAVIKINGKNLPAIELADSSKLQVGQYCMAIGNPGGLQFMGSATWGIVSGLNRVLSDGGGAGTELIQTDAAINPGNSGGALVNIEGKLIGINSSKLVSESVEGMGFAIPSNTTKDICDKIISKEADPDPYVGVTISQYDAATLQRYGYPVGAWIYSVVKDSPAEAAGIRRGDIITEFNGVEITNYTVLLDAIADCTPGETVKVKFYRASSDRYQTVNLTVDSNNSY